MKVSWMIEDESLEWYRLTPEERWRETQELWLFYLSSGGSLDTEPDSQSPFDPLYSWRESAADGRSGLRAVRRGRIQP